MIKAVYALFFAVTLPLWAQQTSPSSEPASQNTENTTVPNTPATSAPHAAPTPEQDASSLPWQAAYQGIVKIDVAKLMPDYTTPWQMGAYGRSYGTGFMVKPGLFMTNAHVVAHGQRIYISPYADSRKIPAHVKYVAHDADLALVEVEDPDAFQDVPCLELAEGLPQLEAEVRAIGYPIGGNRLSVTRGIVSRIDTIPYSHTRNDAHLTIQIDAAINPGNSGGPVLLGDRVIGVAFQGLMEANSTGYVIPIPVIRRFLQDIQDGRYDHYVDLGVTFFPLENPAMRRHYQLPDNATGALVGDVVVGGSCSSVLEAGDVVLGVNGHPVDSSGMIGLDGERVQLKELAERSFNGDQMQFDILRHGERLQVTATLHPLRHTNLMALDYHETPRFVEFAGLVFQPLQMNTILAHKLKAIDFHVTLDHFLNHGGSLEKNDLIVLTKVLPDEINARLNDFGHGLVTRVNGVEVRGLSHLAELLYPPSGQERPPYTTIELKGAPRPLVIDNAEIDAANERIRASYNIPHATSL